MTIIIIFHIALIVPLLIGVPIGIGLLVCGFALMMYMGETNPQIIAMHLMRGTDVPSMMALPFFILSGELMNRGGLTTRIVDFARLLVGSIRGGLGYVTIIACLLFSSLIGSAVASTAALAAVLIPMMAQAGYDRPRAAALISGTNMMMPIMPPSVPLIVYGIAAEVSIRKLFMAGIVPGLYLAGAAAIVWFFVSRKDPVDKVENRTAKSLLNAFTKAIWALLMPVILVVGMRGGIFTPTEAGVVAVAYALFVGSVVNRELNFKEIWSAFIASAKMSSVIMFLAATATLAAYMMTIGRIPQIITDALSGLTTSPTAFMLVVVLIVTIVGLAMDVVPAILILTPILMPLVKAAHIDPVYFGIIFVTVNVLGLITPPVGPVLNVACSAGKISLESVIRPVLPYFIVQTILVLFMVFFPEMVLAPMRWILG